MREASYRPSVPHDVQVLAKRLVAIDARDDLIYAVARDFGVLYTALVREMERLRG